MRSFKIESYVPEKDFFAGKDARFCLSVFDDCCVVDIHNNGRILCACRNGEHIGTSLTDAFSLSMADTATLLHLFDGSNEFLMLPSPHGTLLIYPAWQCLGLALVFLMKESSEKLQNAHKNAQRYAFSLTFDVKNEKTEDPDFLLETKLCTLQFYTRRLFGSERQSNVTAQMLMIANLTGCRLHEMSVANTAIRLDEGEMDCLSAYLFCVFMTMRRYNGRVSASNEEETDEKGSFSTHVPQKYGMRIQQSVKERIIKPTAFDLPSRADVASFATHPAFSNYRIEEIDGTIRMHIPLRQKAMLSSILSRDAARELTVTLFRI